MTNAPYLLEQARAGYRIGHDRVVDSMFLDGLEDAYDTGRLMGAFAEDCAAGLSVHPRSAGRLRDALARARASGAMRDGAFAAEIAPVDVEGGQDETIVADDEQPPKARPAKIPTLKPAFAKAARSPPPTRFDLRRRSGAGADARQRRRAAWASRRSRASSATRPTPPSRRPSPPRRSARCAGCSKAGWSAGDVDLFEINEAFAVVAMTAMRDLDLPARQGQRQRRRLRARPSHRRVGRAHPRHAAGGAGSARRQARRRLPVHRRRRGTAMAVELAG